MKRALYLNKFHIMHKGLVAAVQDMAMRPDIGEVVLGICSSQFDDRHKSPDKSGLHNVLGLEERVRVMDSALSHIPTPIRYVAIPDIFPIDKSVPENRWIESVDRRAQPFDVVFTDRSVESECFSHKNYEIREVPHTVLFSDHCVRDKIARREIWQPYVPQPAVRELQELDIEGRLERLYAQKEVPSDVGVTYEWRSFGDPSSEVAERIMELPDVARVLVQDDYLVSLTSSAINLKYRNGLKVKELITSVPDGEVRRGQGGYDVFTDYHIEHERDYRDFCRQTRFPVPRLSLPRSVEGLVSRVPEEPNPYCMHLPVEKRRIVKSFEGGCAVEFSQVRVMDEEHVTVGLESSTKRGLYRAKEALGLEGENMNYVQFFEGLLARRYGDELYQNMWVR